MFFLFIACSPPQPTKLDTENPKMNRTQLRFACRTQLP